MHIEAVAKHFLQEKIRMVSVPSLKDISLPTKAVSPSCTHESLNSGSPV